MRISPLIFLVFASSALCQQTVAPTPESVGRPRGDDYGGYNIVQSYETGYRFFTTGGDEGKYRSDVNYRNGLRFLGSSLSVNSKEGQGGLFDEITLSTQGLGNDPYETAILRIRKNGLYRYDMAWRQNEYYNPALTISNGEHFRNTTHHMQDHDLTLLPQSKVKFFLGYSRNSQTGPALSTIQLFDTRGNEFPLFEDIRRVRNEYRLGGEAQLFGFRLNVLHGWDNFKEDSPYMLSGTGAGDEVGNRTTLTSFTRSEPYHGNSPYWRVALFREGKSWYAVNGRFTYTAGSRGFVLDESAYGTARFGVDNRQVLTYGTARRPMATGNLTVSVFPLKKLTITNQTSYYSLRIDGNSYYQVVDNATLSIQLANFQYLGIRTFSNSTDAVYQFTPRFGIHAGYQYSNRRDSSIENLYSGTDVFPITGEHTNELHAGTVGFRLRPVKPLIITVDGEVGRASRPFLPTSEKNYQAVGGRIQYKLKTFRAGAALRTNYNFNSASLTAYSSKARSYSFDGSWTPLAWFSLDASYSKQHLDTQGGIVYFASFAEVDGERSIYVSNLHAANLGTRFEIRKRIDLYLGYSRVQDTGDGRSNILGSGAGSASPAFQAVQTFPLTYQTPLARVSIKLREKLRWNAGYQYYGYHEQFQVWQNYRAHTGYTSLLWTF